MLLHGTDAAAASSARKRGLWSVWYAGYMDEIGSRGWAEGLLRGVLRACDPAGCVRGALQRGSSANVPNAVLAMGKAAAGMAQGALEALGSQGLGVPLCVMGPDERMGELRRRDGTLVLEGDHPLSTARNQANAARVLEWLREHGPMGEVLVLLSGGASAYLVSPMGDLRREELDEVYAAIRRGGGTIEELNAVRKHCEGMKGGRLAGIAKSTQVLVMSDVLGDRLDVISSGPFVADASTCGDAAGVMTKFGLDQEFRSVFEHVSDKANETPKAGDSRFLNVRHEVLISNATAVHALKTALVMQKIRITECVQEVRGEPWEIAKRLQHAIRGLKSGEGIVLGGEPTVDARHAAPDARGGPSQELVLALAKVIEVCGVSATAWGFSTDGQDGNSPYAGGWLSSSMVSQSRNRGVVLEEFREQHDASSFLEEAAGEFFTGPTGVNVNHVACVVRNT